MAAEPTTEVASTEDKKPASHANAPTNGAPAPPKGEELHSANGAKSNASPAKKSSDVPTPRGNTPPLDATAVAKPKTEVIDAAPQVNTVMPVRKAQLATANGDLPAPTVAEKNPKKRPAPALADQTPGSATPEVVSATTQNPKTTNVGENQGQKPPGGVKEQAKGTPAGASATVDRPRSTAQPAVKRARVAGTLDAAQPAQTATADLSEETLRRYVDASRFVGIHLVARASENVPMSGVPKKDFVDDHARYMQEIGKDFKVRTIGGNKLDIYILYKSVLERGGVQAVICSRTFRLVARALDLPRSCTSAAFILRSEYEKILYLYEQKHVWNRDPHEVPPLTVLERGNRPAINIIKYTSARVQNAVSNVNNSNPATPANVRTASKDASTPTATPVQPTSSSRPKRQAALAASSAVAAAVSDDPYGTGSGSSQRRARTGMDDTPLTPTEEQIVEEELTNENAPHSVYVPGVQGEKERVIAALWSPVHDDVAWGLGTLNALSFDARNTFQARSFPGILDALYEILHRHLQDVLCARTFGLGGGMEEIDGNAPRVVSMAAIDIDNTGDILSSSNAGLSKIDKHQSVLRSSSLQKYGTLFNVVDAVAVDREQCAVVAVNILRNMSFSDRNAIFLAESEQILELSAEIMLTAQIPANLRDGLIDMWINVSPYLNVSKGYAGHVVLTTSIKLLDPFLEGADFSRFTNCGEVLARLAASPERNEEAFVAEFAELLPRLVDMLGGKDRRYVNAGLAALCNCSAFDWPARSRIARVPRAMSRLVSMLADPELSPRAALTLLNLAEAPSNRSVLLAYEAQLVAHAMRASPASDTVASILFDLSND